MVSAEQMLVTDWPTQSDGLALSAYLLGMVDFDDVLRLQRRLHFDITGQRDQAVVLLCEHPPLITVGRHGSACHIWMDQHELSWRGWGIRWVQRGGGCWLHLHGQLAIYFLLPLDAVGLSLVDYQSRLGETLRRVLDDFGVHAEPLPTEGGVAVGQRLIAGLGSSVRDWVTTYGACLNIHPDLDAYRLVRAHPRTEQPMTSLARERHGPVRPALVRQRLLEHLVAVFGFSRVSLFTSHPALAGATQRCTSAVSLR